MNPTPRTDALLVELSAVHLEGLTPSQIAGEIGIPGDGEDLGPALRALERLIVHARQLEHEHGTRAAVAPDQLAACRAVVAQLHGALKIFVDAGADAHHAVSTVEAAARVLEASEPHALDVIGKARALLAAMDALDALDGCKVDTEPAEREVSEARRALAAVLPPEPPA